MVYESLIVVKKGFQKSVCKREGGFVKGNRRFGNGNVIKNVPVLLFVLVRMYSYSAFGNVLILTIVNLLVLVLVKMYSAPGLQRWEFIIYKVLGYPGYSYSAFSNVLILIHHQCTLIYTHENVLDHRSAKVGTHRLQPYYQDTRGH